MQTLMKHASRIFKFDHHADARRSPGAPQQELSELDNPITFYAATRQNDHV